MQKYLKLCVLSAVALLVLASSANAQLKGAIFTTDVNGHEVNANIYPAKTDVYLDGGPGNQAPQGAAALPDGTYVFQVTDPSGKTLLSLDLAKCRQLTIKAGIITSVVPAGGCQHLTGLDVDHNALTVQLMPYSDTPNNGGVYKAWVTPLADYLQGCSALGIANGLNVVDCGQMPNDDHGFIHSHSKTDNFKVKIDGTIQEVDTYFYDANFNLLAGLCETWIDTLGVSNTRCSGGSPTRAHVEAVEAGVHQFIIYPQPGCMTFTGGVSQYVGNKLLTTQTFSGGPLPATIDITIKPNFTGSIIIDVYCAP